MASEELKKLERKMNDYIVSTKSDELLTYDNLGLFYIIASTLQEELHSYFDDSDWELDYDKIPQITIFDKINLVKSFYKEMGIDFDFERYISDGTIAFDYYEGYPCYYGRNYNLDNKNLVDSSNNGLLTDAFVLVHELSHLRDQPSCGRRNQINDFFTETLAYAEEFVFANYLSSTYYDIEDDWLICMERQLYYIANETLPIFKLFLLYENLGDISRESYLKFYDKDEDYDDEIKNLKIYLDDSDKSLMNFRCWYILAAFLAPFMYREYKKDSSYMEKIKLLHDKINNSSIVECLKIMGLSDLGPNDRERIVNSINEIKEEFITKRKNRK